MSQNLGITLPHYFFAIGLVGLPNYRVTRFLAGIAGNIAKTHLLLLRWRPHSLHSAGQPTGTQLVFCASFGSF